MTERNVKDFLQASYLPQKDAASFINQKYGYQFDPELSTMQTKVFLSPGSNEAIITHRGSKRIVDDWINTNLPLAVGMEGKTQRFQQAKTTLDLVKDKYPGFQITSLGHSLGGSIARNSGSDRSITYDAGYGLGDIGKNISQNERSIRASRDPVSSLSNVMFGKKEIVNVNSINPLKIHSVKDMPEDIFF